MGPFWRLIFYKNNILTKSLIGRTQNYWIMPLSGHEILFYYVRNGDSVCWLERPRRLELMVWKWISRRWGREKSPARRLHQQRTLLSLWSIPLSLNIIIRGASAAGRPSIIHAARKYLRTLARKNALPKHLPRSGRKQHNLLQEDTIILFFPLRVTCACFCVRGCKIGTTQQARGRETKNAPLSPACKRRIWYYFVGECHVKPYACLFECLDGEIKREQCRENEMQMQVTWDVLFLTPRAAWENENFMMGERARCASGEVMDAARWWAALLSATDRRSGPNPRRVLLLHRDAPECSFIKNWRQLFLDRRKRDTGESWELFKKAVKNCTFWGDVSTQSRD